MLIELLLEDFIRIIDTKLLKTIDFEVFETINIENTDELIIEWSITRTWEIINEFEFISTIGIPRALLIRATIHENIFS